MHVRVELVARGRVRIARVRISEHADGVNERVFVLERFRRADGVVGHRAVKSALMVGLAVGEEDDDLLGIIARTGEHGLRVLHAVVGGGGARSRKAVDHARCGRHVL